jgi:hypothetical protein
VRGRPAGKKPKLGLRNSFEDGFYLHITVVVFVQEGMKYKRV